jgi:hypothetical protein
MQHGNMRDLLCKPRIYLDLLPGFVKDSNFCEWLRILSLDAFCARVCLMYHACFSWGILLTRDEYCSKELIVCADPSGMD